MKRPNQYSKPLEGDRKETYHPADLDGQYVKDLNKYIDHLELQLKDKLYSEEDMRLAIDFTPYYLEYGNIVGKKSDKDIEEFIGQFKKK